VLKRTPGAKGAGERERMPARVNCGGRLTTRFLKETTEKTALVVLVEGAWAWKFCQIPSDKAMQSGAALLIAQPWEKCFTCQMFRGPIGKQPRQDPKRNGNLATKGVSSLQKLRYNEAGRLPAEMGCSFLLGKISWSSS
jgi:hypothetical protein